MPQRCVKCNEPADQPTIARKVYWYSPWLYLLLLFNIIIFALIAVLVRKTAMVAPGLCVEHKKRRRTAIALSWTGALIGIVVMYVGMATPLGVWGAAMGVLVILASVVAGMIFGRVVYASRIDKSYVRLKGSGELFLRSLPPFPG